MTLPPLNDASLDDIVLNDADVTLDALYGGALMLYQPKKGFRVNLDTVLLAAAADRHARNTIEIGAGAGGVSLALAQQCPDMAVTAVELDPMMAGLLARNIAMNNLSDQVDAVMADGLMDTPPWASSGAGQHDQVVMNPPYHDAASTPSIDMQKSMAKAAHDLTPWIDAGRKALKHKGRLVMISRGDRVDQIITALTPNFGEITLRPVFARPDDTPAKRVLISARSGVRGGAEILPPVTIHADEKGDALTPMMAAIEKGQATIAMTSPSRQIKRRIK